MAIKKIVKVPNPILKKKSKKISKIDSRIEQLAYDMADTIENYQSDVETGVAMAAIQVGQPVNLVVVREEDGSYAALINPEVTKAYGKDIEDLEGCLSVPGIYGVVSRKEKVEVKGIAIDGERFAMKASGIFSRILQHEIDHLNGILFTDRVISLDKLYKLNKEGKLVSKTGEILDESGLSKGY